MKDCEKRSSVVRTVIITLSVIAAIAAIAAVLYKLFKKYFKIEEANIKKEFTDIYWK